MPEEFKSQKLLKNIENTKQHAILQMKWIYFTEVKIEKFLWIFFLILRDLVFYFALYTIVTFLHFFNA